MTQPQLIVGVGNLDRGDDAVGILVARRIRGARVREVRDCSNLVDLWSAEPVVTVVDAMVTGSNPGTISRLDGVADHLPVGGFQSTHAFGLAQSVELGRALGRLPYSLTIYGIEGARFATGDNLSPEVEAAADVVAARIQAEIG